MSVDTINASGVFRVGDVLSRAGRLLAGNILFFLLAPFVIYAVMVIAFLLLGMTFFFGGWASGSTVLIGLGIGLAIIVALSLTMVGQGVLRACLGDDRVDQTVSVGRSSTGMRHAKLQEIQLDDEA